MITIWKYVLEPESNFMLPIGAEILTVAVQGEKICLWVKVNTESPRELRSFSTFGTGYVLPDEPGMKLKYIGTSYFDKGIFVFHTFERITNMGEEK